MTWTRIHAPVAGDRLVSPPVAALPVILLLAAPGSFPAKAHGAARPGALPTGRIAPGAIGKDTRAGLGAERRPRVRPGAILVFPKHDPRQWTIPG